MHYGIIVKGFVPIAQSDRVTVSETVGREFESPSAQFIQLLAQRFYIKIVITDKGTIL